MCIDAPDAQPRIFSVLLVLMLTLVAAPARGAPGPQACDGMKDRQVLANTGLRIYRDSFAVKDDTERTRLLEGSLHCFLLALDKGPSPLLYHPLGLVYEKLERFGEATESFQRYLAEVPEQKRPPGVTKKLTDKLVELRKLVAELSIDTQPGLEVRVDEYLVGHAPLDRLVAVPPGPHVITVGNPEVGSKGIEVRVGAGEVRLVDLTGWRPRDARSEAGAKMTAEEERPTAAVEKVALIPPAAPVPPKKPLWRKPWFWTAVTGGVVVLATVITLGVVLGSPAPQQPLPAVVF
jgi:hypothetical protein